MVIAFGYRVLDISRRDDVTIRLELWRGLSQMARMLNASVVSVGNRPGLRKALADAVPYGREGAVTWLPRATGSRAFPLRGSRSSTAPTRNMPARPSRWRCLACRRAKTASTSTLGVLLWGTACPGEQAAFRPRAPPARHSIEGA